MSVVFDIGDADGLTQHLSDTIKKARRAGLKSAALRLSSIIVNDLIPNAKPRPPDDQGAYKAGWGPGCITELEDGDVILMTNTAPHAPIVEFGAKAENVKIGRAFINALAEWVVRKGLVGKGRGSIQGRALEDEAQSMAWAIGKTMQKKGIFNHDGDEGLRIAEKARALAPKIVAEELAAEIQDALRGI